MTNAVTVTSTAVTTVASSTVSFLDTPKGKTWLNKKIKNAYGAKIATDAKAAARKKAIARSYGLKKGAEAKAALKAKKITAYYAEKKAA